MLGFAKYMWTITVVTAIGTAIYPNIKNKNKEWLGKSRKERE